VKVIHGYGSSGKGGAIRSAIREQLAQWQREGKVLKVVPGENWSIFDPACKTCASATLFLARMKTWTVQRGHDAGRISRRYFAHLPFVVSGGNQLPIPPLRLRSGRDDNQRKRPGWQSRMRRRSAAFRGFLRRFGRRAPGTFPIRGSSARTNSQHAGPLPQNPERRREHLPARCFLPQRILPRTLMDRMVGSPAASSGGDPRGREPHSVVVSPALSCL